jgi:hypothetical protein
MINGETAHMQSAHKDIETHTHACKQHARAPVQEHATKNDTGAVGDARAAAVQRGRHGQALQAAQRLADFHQLRG